MKMKVARYPNQGFYALLENSTMADRRALISSGYEVSGSHGKFRIYIPQDHILTWLLCRKLQSLGFAIETGNENWIWIFPRDKDHYRSPRTNLAYRGRSKRLKTNGGRRITSYQWALLYIRESTGPGFSRCLGWTPLWCRRWRPHITKSAVDLLILQDW